VVQNTDSFKAGVQKLCKNVEATSKF